MLKPEVPELTFHKGRPHPATRESVALFSTAREKPALHPRSSTAKINKNKNPYFDCKDLFPPKVLPGSRFGRGHIIWGPPAPAEGVSEARVLPRDELSPRCWTRGAPAWSGGPSGQKSYPPSLPTAKPLCFLLRAAAPRLVPAPQTRAALSRRPWRSERRCAPGSTAATT